jgi:hypothetical protein
MQLCLLIDQGDEALTQLILSLEFIINSLSAGQIHQIIRRFQSFLCLLLGRVFFLGFSEIHPL